MERKREYAELAFGFLRVDNPIRKLCITLSEHPLFEAIVIVVILVNCVFLAMMEPTKGDDEGRNALVNSTEGIFTGLFLAELVIKVVAMGFCLDDLSYMREGWNIMDFIVVAASLVALFPGVTNVSSIRTMRVLRPLRTVTVLPGIRVLVSAMLESLPMMANVVLCLLFLFILFGILGMSLFMGVLRNRCHEVDIVEGIEVFTVADEENTCTSKIRMGFGGRLCPEGQICMPYENPNFGITSFDNFLWSVNTIFHCITLEGWTPIMYWTMDATTVWSFLYFVVLIWVGDFFVLQLALAVVTDSYADMAEDEAERQAEEQQVVEEEQEKKEMKKKYSLAVAESEKQMFAGLGGDQEGISLSGIFRAIVEKRWFSPTIFFLIFANTVAFHGVRGYVGDVQGCPGHCQPVPHHSLCRGGFPEDYRAGDLRVLRRQVEHVRPHCRGCVPDRDRHGKRRQHHVRLPGPAYLARGQADPRLDLSATIPAASVQNSDGAGQLPPHCADHDIYLRSPRHAAFRREVRLSGRGRAPA